MTILLIRHAESAGNINSNVYSEMADHAIPLTDKGRQQAKDVGVFINDFYKTHPPQKPVRLWSSPYVRTTQTTLLLRDNAPDVKWDTCSRGSDIHFDDRLREREWGPHQLDDYRKDSALKESDPLFHAYFNRVWEAPQGLYFMRPKGGESAADVASRLRSFFQDLYFDISRGVTDHVIVTHARTMMAFFYAFTKVHPLFMDDERLGGNTSVRLLDKDAQTGRYADYGFVYDPSENIYLLNKPETPIARDVTEKLKTLLSQ